MSSLSVVNDSSVSRSDVLQRTVLMATGTALDFHANGFNGTLYVICTSATTLTLPADYGRYKGRVLHVSGNGAAATVAQSATSSGAVFDITGGTAINAGGSASLAASGAWVSLVCDGSTGWLVFAKDVSV
jgi:hypothetical protein